MDTNTKFFLSISPDLDLIKTTNVNECFVLVHITNVPSTSLEVLRSKFSILMSGQNDVLIPFNVKIVDKVKFITTFEFMKELVLTNNPTVEVIYRKAKLPLSDSIFEILDSLNWNN